MKKIFACYGRKSEPKVELARLPLRRPKKTLERSSEQASEQPSKQFLWAQRFSNYYFVSGAVFLPDGGFHKIMISFEGEEESQMKFIIDDEMIYEVDTKQQHAGEFELHTTDGIVVDCFWDLTEIPKVFKFHTRKYYSSHTRIAGSSSHGGADDDNPEHLDDYYHIHSLEIRGD